MAHSTYCRPVRFIAVALAVLTACGVYLVGFSFKLLTSTETRASTNLLYEGRFHKNISNGTLNSFREHNSYNNNNNNNNKNNSDFRNVKVLCWVMTSPATLYSKAKHIKETWGPRCDVTLYISSQVDNWFPTVALDVQESRKVLWNKTRLAFQYIYKHHFHDADWFMKADDDTYVIVDNLRYFLADKNSSAAVYYGHNFQMFTRQGYMSGGAGYVLSREAVRRFAVEGASQPRCRANYEAEDIGIGKCLQDLGVLAGDSRDSLNRSRFLPLSIGDFVNAKLPPWYSQYKKYNVEKGSNCCSDYLISCHYVKPQDMHALDYMVYHLRPAATDDDHVYRTDNRTAPIAI